MAELTKMQRNRLRKLRAMRPQDRSAPEIKEMISLSALANPFNAMPATPKPAGRPTRKDIRS